MHIIVLVIIMTFVQTAGGDRPPEMQFVASKGGTMEQCKARGKAMVEKFRNVAGVTDAEFACSDLLMKAAI
jgi:hypothetical protein